MIFTKTGETKLVFIIVSMLPSVSRQSALVFDDFPAVSFYGFWISSHVDTLLVLFVGLIDLWGSLVCSLGPRASCHRLGLWRCNREPLQPAAELAARPLRSIIYVIYYSTVYIVCCSIVYIYSIL